MDVFINKILSFSIASSSTSIVIFLIFMFMLFVAIKWQKESKINFSDIITYPNTNNVSLTKVIQLFGGIVSSWVIVKLTIQESITWDIFFIYLLYTGGVETFSKYFRNKYKTGISQNTEKDNT